MKALNIYPIVQVAFDRTAECQWSRILTNPRDNFTGDIGRNRKTIVRGILRALRSRRFVIESVACPSSFFNETMLETITAGTSSGVDQE